MRFWAGVLVCAIATHAQAEPFPWSAWDVLVAKNVDDHGLVRYGDIDRSALDKLVAALASTSPHKDPRAFASRETQLAYWIDGYNIVVWASVLRRWPGIKSVIDDKHALFETTQWAFGDERLTLENVEHRVRDLGDARVHMVLNCASLGCPQLPRHAFVPTKIESQLDEETRRFCEDKRNVDYDAGTNSVRLSQIFDWYKADFGKSVIAWIDKYRTQKIPLDAKVSYAPYDWRLNGASR